MTKSTKEPELDRDLIQRLRVDIDAALEKVAKQHGVSLKAGYCSFDPTSGNFTFKLEGVAKGGVDKAGALYNSLLKFKPELPPLLSEFEYDSKTHQIVGANTTGTKIITKCGEKRFQFPVDAVERLCKKKSSKG